MEQFKIVLPAVKVTGIVFVADWVPLLATTVTVPVRVTEASTAVTVAVFPEPVKLSPEPEIDQVKVGVEVKLEAVAVTVIAWVAGTVVAGLAVKLTLATL